MKKRGLLLITFVLLGCLSVLVACNKEKLPSPVNIRLIEFDEQTTLTWDQVPYSTGGYMVEIDGTPYKSETHQYTVAHLETGTYSFRVRALTKDKNYYKNSDWSEKKQFLLQKESGVIYELINNASEYAVSDIGTAKDVVTIFDSYKGKPITTIAENAFANSASRYRITGIILGNNITRIEDSAFYGCTRLETLVIPDSVTYIGNRAFGRCQSLKTMVLPKNLTYLGENAFNDCTSLESVTFPDSLTYLPSYSLALCSSLESVTLGNNMQLIGEFAFSYTKNLKNLTIPDSVEYLSQKAFAGSGIQNITFGKGLLMIGNNAFELCENLATIDIPDSVNELGSNVFLNSAIYKNAEEDIFYAGNWLVGTKAGAKIGLITNISVKEGTVGICNSAFKGFTNLNDVRLPDSMKYIGIDAFLRTKIWESSEELVIADDWIVGVRLDLSYNHTPTPDTVLYVDVTVPSYIVGISNYALAEFLALKNIFLPAGLKYIGANAFYMCNNLEAIDIPSGIVSIGSYAFYSCYKLTEVEIPEGIEKLEGTFWGCMALEKVILPETLTVIGDYTFYGCYVLSSVGTLDEIEGNTIKIQEGITSIGAYAFYSVGVTLGESSLFRVLLPDSLTTIAAYAFGFCSGLTSIVIPAGISVISAGAFMNCTALSDIEFLGTITRIESEAFSYCYSLEEFDIPDTVTYIGNKAFHYCVALQTIVVPEGITTLSRDIFSWCAALESVILPTTLKRIEEYAFLNCYSLQKIDLPLGLKAIAKYAFMHCVSLESMTLSSKIDGIGESAFYGSLAITFYIDDTMRPINWSLHWNSFKRPVVWGCVLSEDKSYVISVAIGEDSINYIPQIPDEFEEILYEPIKAPYRKGHRFLGWAISEDSTLPEYYDISDVPVGFTAYAIWEENNV